MSRSVIHCLKGEKAKSQLMIAARKAGLAAKSIGDSAFEVIGAASREDLFLSQFSRNEEVAIFAHTSHPSTTRNIFQPYVCRRNVPEDEDEIEAIPNEASTPVQYVKTQVAMKAQPSQVARSRAPVAPVAPINLMALAREYIDLPRQINSVQEVMTTTMQAVNPNAIFEGRYGRTADTFGKYYQFPEQKGTAPTIAIISLGGSYRTTDLTRYWQSIMGLKTLPVVTSVAVKGAPNKPNQRMIKGDGSEENTLDIEIAGGLCPRAKIVVYFARNTTRGFYDAVNEAIYDKVNNPTLISISWGGPEVWYQPIQLKAYDQLFQEARLKGIVITVASGDNGSRGNVANGRANCDFPASSPHVISCGGTRILPKGESAWSWTTQLRQATGGGISSIFPIPSYQKGVTASASHRAVPDLSLNADPGTGWTICYGGQLHVNSWGGTSCVAPAIAALLALMNLNYKQPVNEAFYEAAKIKNCYRDVLTGNNDHYNAGPGHDLCTGLGSVNGDILMRALQVYL